MHSNYQNRDWRAGNYYHPCCQKLPCFIMSCNLITRADLGKQQPLPVLVISSGVGDGDIVPAGHIHEF